MLVNLIILRKDATSFNFFNRDYVLKFNELSYRFGAAQIEQFLAKVFINQPLKGEPVHEMSDTFSTTCCLLSASGARMEF